MPSFENSTSTETSKDKSNSKSGDTDEGRSRSSPPRSIGPSQCKKSGICSNGREVNRSSTAKPMTDYSRPTSVPTSSKSSPCHPFQSAQRLSTSTIRLWPPLSSSARRVPSNQGMDLTVRSPSKNSNQRSSRTTCHPLQDLMDCHTDSLPNLAQALCAFC